MSSSLIFSFPQNLPKNYVPELGKDLLPISKLCCWSFDCIHTSRDRPNNKLWFQQRLEVILSLGKMKYYSTDDLKKKQGGLERKCMW